VRFAQSRLIVAATFVLLRRTDQYGGNHVQHTSDRVGNIAVVEYERRVVRGDEAFKFATRLKKSFSNSLLAVLLAMQTGETGLDLQNGVSNSPPASDLLT